MTVENLMMPRYKVIADYPHNPYKIGDLLEEFTKTAFKLTVTYNGNSMDETQANTYPASAIEKMPHLFRKLNWWEERKVEDMPEYVKVIANGCSFNAGTILKANNWGVYPDEGNNFGNEGDYYCLLITTEESSTHDKGEEVKMNMRNVLPATEQEYNDYINSNSNAKP